MHPQGITPTTICALLERESDRAKAEDAIASQDYVLTIGARERGYTIYDRYVDAGISGEVRDRPALLRLLADAEERRFSLVLATELSRLTRGGLADYFILKSELGRDGVLRIFRMATEGYSLHAIARALVQDGVPTRRGGRWWGSTISAIIGNPRYKGTFVSCRYQAVLPKGPYRPRAGGTVRRRPKTS